jgi:Na+/proline symporter
VDLLLWITIGFIIIGFVVLASMKKGMESKLAFITANTEDEESSAKAKSIIGWIVSTTVWGIVSMILIVWWFQNNFG